MVGDFREAFNPNYCSIDMNLLELKEDMHI
jgi:hypothetical protein